VKPNAIAIVAAVKATEGTNFITGQLEVLFRVLKIYKHSAYLYENVIYPTLRILIF